VKPVIHVVIYDIESDRGRTKVADACKNMGLERMQYSAFWGDLTENRCEELLLQCREIIGDEPARIHIFPLCRQCFQRRIHYATAQYQGLNEAPSDRNANVWFLPDEPDAGPSPGELEPSAPAPTSPQSGESGPRSIAGALRQVARHRRRNKPVGFDDDPWEDADE